MEPEQHVQDTTPLNKWNQATPLSKYLAMALFVALPFIGGWIGYTYAPEKIVEVEKIVVKEVPIEKEVVTNAGEVMKRIDSAELLKDDSGFKIFTGLYNGSTQEYSLPNPEIYSLVSFNSEDHLSTIVQKPINEMQRSHAEFYPFDEGFYVYEDYELSRVSSNGIENIFSFPEPNANYFFDIDDMKVSDDGETLVWVQSGDGPIRLNVTNLIDQTTRSVYEKDGLYQSLFIEKFGCNDSCIYVTETPTGVGGYILFRGTPRFFKVDLETGAVTDLLPKRDGQEGYTSVAVSEDESHIAYMDGLDDGDVVVVKDLSSGNERRVPIDRDGPFRGAGGFMFSPDHTRIVFDMAYWDPDNERERTVLVNLETGVSRPITDSLKDAPYIWNDYSKAYHVLGWIDNNSLLMYQHGSNEFLLIDSETMQIKERIAL